MEFSSFCILCVVIFMVNDRNRGVKRVLIARGLLDYFVDSWEKANRTVSDRSFEVDGLESRLLTLFVVLRASFYVAGSRVQRRCKDVSVLFVLFDNYLLARKDLGIYNQYTSYFISYMMKICLMIQEHNF